LIPSLSNEKQEATRKKMMIMNKATLIMLTPMKLKVARPKKANQGFQILVSLRRRMIKRRMY
jgi:hypothetical protein